MLASEAAATSTRADARPMMSPESDVPAPALLCTRALHCRNDTALCTQTLRQVQVPGSRAVFQPASSKGCMGWELFAMASGRGCIC